MSLKALVFTRDREVAISFTKAIAEVPMNWVLLEDRELPFKLIPHETFDLLIIDCTSGLGRSILSVARQCQANHNSAILAISDGEASPSLLELGADEYVERSAEDSMLAERIREFLPLINRERRSPRHSLNLKVFIDNSEGGSYATALLLSQGGMMLKMERPVDSFEVSSVRFSLPGSTREMHCYCKVVWQGPDSVAGVRFLGLTLFQKLELSRWIAEARRCLSLPTVPS
ncbi:MAG TPA: PilZ domain-containing protein [Candidatus Acidoferrales bacterium]|nr:PilZ domain-containing protein [Candidatus Acidoferrales bacterium]